MILNRPSQSIILVLKILASLYIEIGLTSETTYVLKQTAMMEQACQNQEQTSEEEIELLAMLCDISCVSRTASPAA